MTTAERDAVSGQAVTRDAIQVPHDTHTAVAHWYGDFRDHQGFDSSWNIPGATSSSAVMVSISELGIVNGQLVPVQGLASCQVHNVVPSQDRVQVRGLVGWDSDLNLRLHFIVVA